MIEDRFGLRELREPGICRPSAEADDVALAAAEVGMWDYDIPGGRVTWDRRAAELIGGSPDSFGGTVEAFFALVHPDDVLAARASVDAAVQACGSFLAEYRVVRPDGAQVWIQGLGRVVSSSAGRATRATGVVVDVTWRRSMVETLQRAILPQTLPELPGMELVTRYLPAGRDVGIGGDWYDAAVLPDGSVTLVVGDVGGHGLPAVATMAELRHAARAYALEGHPPAAITTQLSANLANGPDATLATAIVANLAPTTRHLTWSSAGHPPPLLLTTTTDAAAGPGTDTAYLDDVHGPILGVDPALAYGQSDRDLPPGARFFLYTDGLVERRDISITDRLDTLAATAAAAANNRDMGFDGLDRLCDRILADVPDPADREDDLCLLAIQTP